MKNTRNIGWLNRKGGAVTTSAARAEAINRLHNIKNQIHRNFR